MSDPTRETNITNLSDSQEDSRERLRQTPYFGAFDGLRAISVFLVIAYHVVSPTPEALTLGRYVEGHLAVDIFFVLSGFLITTLLLREEAKNGRIALGEFYVRRCFRIFPMYLFGIVAYLALGLLPGQHDKFWRTIAGLPYFFTFRNEYIPPNVDATYTHTWSLSIEEKFYFIWPILFFIVLKPLRARWMILLLPFAIYWLLPAMDDYHFVIYYTSYVSILIGSVVAISMHRVTRLPDFLERSLLKIPGWLMVSIGVACYSISLTWFMSAKLVFSLYIGIFLLYLVFKDSIPGRVLGSRTLGWLGKRTYSMYLLHAIFLNFVEHKLLIPTTNVRYVAVVLITYVLVAIAAHVTYSLIEQPMIRYGKRCVALMNQRKTKRDG